MHRPGGLGGEYSERTPVSVDVVTGRKGRAVQVRESFRVDQCAPYPVPFVQRRSPPTPSKQAGQHHASIKTRWTLPCPRALALPAEAYWTRRTENKVYIISLDFSAVPKFYVIVDRVSSQIYSTLSMSHKAVRPGVSAVLASRAASEVPMPANACLRVIMYSA